LGFSASLSGTTNIDHCDAEHIVMQCKPFNWLRTALATVALVTLAITALASVGIVTMWILNRPTGLSGAVRVEITTGMTARDIGVALAEEEIIRSPFAFEWLARLTGTAHKLEAGTYELDGSGSTESILQSLLDAPERLKRLTVPEGLTRLQTAGLLARQGFADSARFVSLTEDKGLIRDVGLDAETLEGYLFPETYFIEPAASEREIIKRMVQEFFNTLSDSLYEQLEDSGFSLHEAVTLASIIELEAVATNERSVISSIFHRRLNFKRRLESCATVEYALGIHKKRLTNADLKVVSPYNTYRHRGLPPGPIGSPGKASIHAALNPDDTEYLYFVARGDGTHEFSHTNKEHEAAKRTIKRKERQARRQANL
jgi:UPF0755 protein